MLEPPLKPSDVPISANASTQKPCVNKVSSNGTQAHITQNNLLGSVALHSSKALDNRMMHILHAMPSGIVILNANGVVEQANPAACDLLLHNISGKEAQNEAVLIDEALSDSPLQGQLVGRLWRKIIKTAFVPQNDDAYEVLLRSGRRVSIAIRPLTPEPGQLIVLTDLTEIRQLQNQLDPTTMMPFQVKAQVKRQVKDLVKAQIKRRTKGQVIAVDEKSLALLTLAQKVARSSASVMILGPSGTGKEVLARYIHESSERAMQPFIAINCAAIPDTMLEATLFGYEKGAFTGAHQACPGKFEQAQGGSILLDEISEMPLALQAKLLRVLQERELERLGGKKTIQLDVRVLATSNRDLQQCVTDGRFREDLYYRINVFPLTWPALKDRVKDILPLTEHLLRCHAEPSLPITLSERAKARLLAYGWPGNVRELDNVIQRALIVTEGQVIHPQALFLNDDWQEREHEYEHAHIKAADVNIDSEQEYMLEQAAQATQDIDIVSLTASESANNKTAYLCERCELTDKSRLFQTVHSSINQLASQDQQGQLAQFSVQKQSQEYQLILETLQHFQGHRQSVAEKLGISPRTLRYKMAKMRELGMAIPSA